MFSPGDAGSHLLNSIVFPEMKDYFADSDGKFFE
jgi:hypothetical protein